MYDYHKILGIFYPFPQSAKYTMAVCKLLDPSPFCLDIMYTEVPLTVLHPISIDKRAFSCAPQVKSMLFPSCFDKLERS